MKICVIGTGYVGLVTAAVFSHLGFKVTGLDIDKSKIDQLQKGKLTIYEPGLKTLVTKNLQNHRLNFTTDYKSAIKDSQFIFICVGTPAQRDGSYDPKFVFAAAKEIARHLKTYAVIVIKSTVPPSTTRAVKDIIQSHTKVKFDVASVPEFLREGSAINDALHPSRVILGVDSKKAETLLKKVHQKLKSPILVTTPQSAQLTKYASNAMLATRISFINAIAILCDKVEADVKAVSQGLGLDPRIGQSFLQPGIGYGGSCFPKDTWALISFAKKLGYDFNFLKQVDQVNTDQVDYFITKIKSVFKDSLKGKILTVLGLAFKPNTDDMREARSIPLINKLQKLGAIVYAYDPVAMPNAQKVLKKVKFFKDPYLALINSDGLVLATEWQEFKDLDLEKIKSSMHAPNIFDGRNLFDPTTVKKLGFKYFAIGRQ